LLENRPDACEVIVACSNAYIDPYGLDDEVQFVRVAARGGWPALANQGLAASRGEILHLLEPGVVVEEGWAEPALEVLRFEQDVSAVSPFVITSGDSPAATITGVRLGRGGRREEVAYTDKLNAIHSFQVLGPSRRAGFYRRSALLAVGGWDPRMGELHADIDLGCALATHGGSCKVMPSCQVKSCRPDVLRTHDFGFACGASAARLLRRYASLSDHPRSLPARFKSAMFDALRELPSPRAVSYLLGRVTGGLVTAKRDTSARANDTDSLRKPPTNQSQAA
jgi:hypothetical protein